MVHTQYTIYARDSRGQYKPNGTQYLSFGVSDNCLVVENLCNNEVALMPVRDCSGYVYKLNKKFISAIGGVDELYRWMANAVKENFGICHVWKICKHVNKTLQE